MKKLFLIKPTINQKRKKKYPYKVKFVDRRVIPVPSQYDFTNNSFIKNHGCIIAAFYMGLRSVGIKMSMEKCLTYLRSNYSKGKHINYNLEIVCKAINKIANGNPATFYKKPSKEEIKKALLRGDMVLYTEKKPTHTSVILWNGKKYKRFSDGKYKTVTLGWEIKKRCCDPWYGGCVIVQKPKKED